MALSGPPYCPLSLRPIDRLSTRPDNGKAAYDALTRSADRFEQTFARLERTPDG